MQLAKELGDKARQRRVIVGGNVTNLLGDGELVGSKLLEVLYDNNKHHLLSSSGISHVFYAPSSTGKTAALMYFMKHYLETYNAPAIMISGPFPGEIDYLICMAAALEIPLKGKEPAAYDISWIKSLLVGLQQRKGQVLEHAPVLILDEFNDPGPNRENILFGESLARYVYGKRIRVLFVTQTKLLPVIFVGAMPGKKLVRFQE